MNANRRTHSNGTLRAIVAVLAAGLLTVASFVNVPAAKATSVIYVALNKTNSGANSGCSAPAYGSLSYASDPDATIQAAIDAAAEGDIIHICQGTWNLYSTAADRAINDADHLNTNSRSMTFRGDGRDKTILKATNFGRLISTSDIAGMNWEPLTIQNIELQGGNVNWNGGAVAARGVTCINSDFVNNSAEAGSGGAIYSEGPVEITSCRFTGNEASDDGGAVWVATYGLSVSGSTFASNTAADCGGGIFAGDVTATVTSTRFEANTADYSAGYCGHYNGSLTVSGSIFRSNLALISIGAAEAREVISSRNQFINNVADDANGALQFCEGSLDRDTFQGNRSSAGYAALNAVCDLISMQRTTFTRNIGEGSAHIVNVPRAAGALRNTISSNRTNRSAMVTVCSRDEMITFLRQNTLKSNSGGPATEIVGCEE